MENDILVLSLVTGEKILAQVQENQGSYICSNVVEIVVDPDETTGQMRMGMVPYLPFCDPDAGVAIPTNMAILAVPSAELKNYYSQKFGLIITPPTPKIIL